MYKDLQSNDERHCLKLRANMNKDSNNLSPVREDIMKEIETRKNDLFRDIDDLKRMSNFFSDSLKLTIDNYADALTKSLDRNLNYCHMDFTMGKLRPDYASAAQIPLSIHSIICRDLRIIGFS